MKKFIIKLFFLLIYFNISYAEQFWSNKVDGPTSNEEAISMLQGKKLDPIEGLWFTDGLGTLLVFEDQDVFKMYIVEGPTDFNGTWEATILKRSGYYDFIGKVWYKQNDGSYEYGTQSGRIDVFSNYFIQKYESRSDQGVEMGGRYTRIWPKNLYTYNNNIKSTDKKKDTDVKKVDTKNDNSDFEKKFNNLNWFNYEDPKNHFVDIPSSNSSVNILESEIYLKGQKDIDKFSQLFFNRDANENDMLILDGEDFNYTIYIDYIDAGYVSLDDWNDVDPKALLKEMKETAKEDVIDVKWVFKPQIIDKRFVTYSYKVSWQDDKDSLETQLISLGRKGYNEISFVKKIDDEFDQKEFEDFAIEFAKTIKFKEGFKHSDYKSGDKAAAVGIGGLVAGTLGVKALAKAGIIAKLLAFAVKFWWVILAPLVFLGSLFNKKSSSGEDSSEKVAKKRKKRSKKTD